MSTRRPPLPPVASPRRDSTVYESVRDPWSPPEARPPPLPRAIQVDPVELERLLVIEQRHAALCEALTRIVIALGEISEAHCDLNTATDAWVESLRMLIQPPKRP